MSLFDGYINPDAGMGYPAGNMQDGYMQPSIDDMGFGMQDPNAMGLPMQNPCDMGMYGNPMMPYNTGDIYGNPMMQQGYGYQPQQIIGRVDQLGMTRYSRGQILQGLRDFVNMNNGKNMLVSKEEKLDDVPRMLRHACAEAKITNLSQCSFNIPEMGISVPFYFCTACGKLFYPREFM